MSRNRFQLLLKFLRFSDNSHMPASAGGDIDIPREEDIARLTERHFVLPIPETGLKQKPQKRCRVCYKKGACKESRRLAPSRLFERRSRTNERRRHEETTCLACMDSNLICILLEGNYCHDVMDAF